MARLPGWKQIREKNIGAMRLLFDGEWDRLWDRLSSRARPGARSRD